MCDATAEDVVPEMEDADDQEVGIGGISSDDVPVITVVQMATQNIMRHANTFQHNNNNVRELDDLPFESHEPVPDNPPQQEGTFETAAC